MNTSITRARLKQLRNNKENVMVIDVRSRDEYNQNHIPFAGNLPAEIIEAGSFIPEPGRIIVTVCGKGGGRSEKTAKYLRESTKIEVYFLDGGTFGWIENEK